MLRWIVATLAGVLPVIAMTLAPDSGAAHDAIRNAFAITAA